MAWFPYMGRREQIAIQFRLRVAVSTCSIGKKLHGWWKIFCI